ncbi:MAG: spore coat protein U domain-containing protein [Acidobacteria bacterium]|nr:spore coat protein U domain-containing protein [Acidobacteriota bacterium]
MITATRIARAWRLAAAATAVAAIVGGRAVHAGSATASLAVNATVINNCTVSTSAVAFGSYDPVVANASTNLDSTGSITIACTKGATATIGLSAGSNASGNARRLSDGASNYLTYELYKDSSRASMWGNSGADMYSPPAAPNKTPRTFTAYARVTSDQDVPAGSYTDTVTATVNF